MLITAVTTNVTIKVTRTLRVTAAPVERSSSDSLLPVYGEKRNHA